MTKNPQKTAPAEDKTAVDEAEVDRIAQASMEAEATGEKSQEAATAEIADIVKTKQEEAQVRDIRDRPAALTPMPKLKPLAVSEIERAEHFRQPVVANIPAGTPIEHLLDGKFWAHCSNNSRVPMTRWAKIEARWQDGSRYAEFLIVGFGAGWVQVELMWVKELSRSTLTMPEGYSTEFIERPVGWRILRKADREVIKGEFINRDSAVRWAHENLREVVAA